MRYQAGFGLIASFLLSLPVVAATVPEGFTESLVANGINAPTAMEFAPDGRLFVLEQSGAVRVIKDGTLLAEPFVQLEVNSAGERGLLGIAFDPDFERNAYVYLYYTVPSPTHNRVSRFVAQGDVAQAESEQVLLELDPLSSATNHNGGALHFNEAGSLFIAVGDNAYGENSQSLATLHGKLLRINPDGSIPTDNPFYATTTGNNRAIWSLGLRNPFTFAIRPESGGMFINDVGQNTWEEVNLGVKGANYGWPTTEGPTTDPRFRSPFFAYQHFRIDPVVGLGCSITGGTFYNPPAPQFPASYQNRYFFADYCGGWINTLDPQGVATRFATGTRSPVDLKTGADGSLYYLSRGDNAVYRVAFTQAPGIATQPTSQIVRVGEAATFTVTASGTAPLTYQWQQDGVAIPGATAPSHTTAPVDLEDDQTEFRVVVTNAAASVTSNPATLTVTASQRPTAVITDPAEGTLFSGGETIFYAGTANDAEDGLLGGSAFTWQVDYYTGTAPARPFVLPTTGATEGSFTVPTSTPYTLADVFYRVILKVTDTAGLTTTVTRDILPRTSTLRLQTLPPGLTLELDGQPQSSGQQFEGVVGITRTLGAPQLQPQSGQLYQFVSWSDGGARVHDISTPATDTTYTAVYRLIAP
ncbi:sorbosone dehydrogenase family protein [Candidatus Cyanaurora vandensis]|uniref:PQQ-dependent sugar dehydrogenase n=1 Tax=Candidatus Cyanaurora vandensis TaxID=2714958 RepID=UPI00257DA9F9|nr:PQQ-dependent sugar dehydrogenase [Candidatus Cyanaurora vandensis]